MDEQAVGVVGWAPNPEAGSHDRDGAGGALRAGRAGRCVAERSDDEALAALWERYKRHDDRHAREQLIARYWPLVEYEARALRARLSSDATPVGDLESYGAEGLIKAVDRFDALRGVRFTTFAAHLIRGAIMDGIRSEDWAFRSVRRRAREIHEVRSRLWNERKRAPSEEEEARALGVTLEAYRSVKKAIADAEVSRLETYDPEALAGSHDADPFEAYVRQERREQVRAALGALRARERIVVALSFGAEIPLAEIGRRLGGITESRVCQIRKEALGRLRSLLG